MNEQTPPAKVDDLQTLRDDIRNHTLPDEQAFISDLLDTIELKGSTREKISAQTVSFVKDVRSHTKPTMMEAFLAEYGLSTQEGVALMTLAEALLRVPDAFTIDDLINDKISGGRWADHVGRSNTALVNTASWALNLTAGVIDRDTRGQALGGVRTLVRRLGEPVVRQATGVAMRQLGHQFVLGRSINEALKNGKDEAEEGYKFSFDMLGEAARTDADAQRYAKAYRDAIDKLAPRCTSDDIRDNPGVSVKLSALHARYEYVNKRRVMDELLPRAKELAVAAKQARMGFNIDAEEADRLDISLDVIEALLRDPDLQDWDGFGVVIQAYGPRASKVIHWLSALTRELGRKVMVRLVKGAYWDTEIKRAQVLGLPGFPVFTRKRFTDLNYIYCAKLLMDKRDHIFPQFATHNAHTMASVLQLAGDDRSNFEFQRLHGMGESLHDVVKKQYGTRCRIYAPVGSHKELLAYLVRRLLENGANSSFVNQIVDHRITPEEIARGPFDLFEDRGLVTPNPHITRPSDIFLGTRLNSIGWDWTDPVMLSTLYAQMKPFEDHVYQVGPIIAGSEPAEAGKAQNRWNPAKPSEKVGEIVLASGADADRAVETAKAAFDEWNGLTALERADIMERVAAVFEENTAEMLLLVQRECGKSLADAIAELREAVDFLYYYAAESRRLSQLYMSPTGESGVEGRGVFVCISPWNFPLAIFTGQIAAALVTGNTVVAKPAEQSPLIAWRAVQLMHKAGVPLEALQLLPGDGGTVGGALTADPRIAGVCFTGSTDTAQRINRAMAEKGNPAAVLIAETGGLNAMLVDSSALPEQVVRDVVASSFQSAGQRCSALRMLYLQEDIADDLQDMLVGAMKELQVGDPLDLATDVGPVIDNDAKSDILDYCAKMEEAGKLIHKLDAPKDADLKDGHFVPPHLVRVSGIEELEREIFGPVLHVATYKAKDADKIIQTINAKGYGLTLGLHSRIESRVERLAEQAHVGNIYVNRNQIGAIVASQPFGGENLSGTGPKAGGPHYLQRFLIDVEQAEPHFVAPVTKLDTLSCDEIDKHLSDLVELTDPTFITDPESHAGRLLRERYADQYMASAELVNLSMPMPGPTGEANTLKLYPKGTLLAFGRDRQALGLQIVQALTLGNAVVLVGEDASRFMQTYADCGLPAFGIDGEVDVNTLTELSEHLDGVIWCGDPDNLQSVRRALAKRDGKIIHLMNGQSSPLAYVSERHMCVDTTAAGGNASLLATSTDI